MKLFLTILCFILLTGFTVGTPSGIFAADSEKHVVSYTIDGQKYDGNYADLIKFRLPNLQGRQVIPIIIEYSDGSRDYLAYNVNYNPPENAVDQVETSGQEDSCPNWKHLRNECVSCGVARQVEEDQCNLGTTQIVKDSEGKEILVNDNGCNNSDWCKANEQPVNLPPAVQTTITQPSRSETACYVNGGNVDKQSADNGCQSTYGNSGGEWYCDQYQKGPAGDGCNRKVAEGGITGIIQSVLNQNQSPTPIPTPKPTVKEIKLDGKTIDLNNPKLDINLLDACKKRDPNCSIPTLKPVILQVEVIFTDSSLNKRMALTIKPTSKLLCSTCGGKDQICCMGENQCQPGGKGGVGSKCQEGLICGTDKATGKISTCRDPKELSECNVNTAKEKSECHNGKLEVCKCDSQGCKFETTGVCAGGKEGRGAEGICDLEEYFGGHPQRCINNRYVQCICDNPNDEKTCSWQKDNGACGKDVTNEPSSCKACGNNQACASYERCVTPDDNEGKGRCVHENAVGQGKDSRCCSTNPISC